MSAHAPGPWAVGDGGRVTVDNVQCWGVPVRAENGDIVAVIVGAPLASNSTLVSVTPDLLALAHQYASECAECDGTRVCGDEEPCTDCADIWAVIDKAEGRS